MASSILESIKLKELKQQQQQQINNDITMTEKQPENKYPLLDTSNIKCDRCSELENRIKKLEAKDLKKVNKRVILLTTRKLDEIEVLNLMKLSTFVELNDAFIDKKIEDIPFTLLYVYLRDDMKHRWYEHNLKYIRNHKDIYDVVMLKNHSEKIDKDILDGFELDSLITDLPVMQLVSNFTDLVEQMEATHLKKLKSSGQKIARILKNVCLS